MRVFLRVPSMVWLVAIFSGSPLACAGHHDSSNDGTDAFGGTASGTGGTSDQVCRDIGYCGPSTNACACGTTCVHYGPGEYMCGFTCRQASDCTSKRNPATDESYGSCNAGLDTPTMTYDGFCIAGSSSSTGAGGGTGAGGSSGAVVPPKPGPECSVQSADTCTCEVTSTPNATSCHQRYGLTHICCGDSMWPSAGECTCTLGTRCGPLLQGTDPGCFCAQSTTYPDFVAGYQSSAACLTPPGKKCCRDATAGTCACYTGIVCKAGQTEESSCVGLQAKCPAGSKNAGQCQR